MRAFLYCRVAHDDSFALEHQRFLLQLYAKQAGYTIIGAADEYGSGLTLDRPAIQKVTEAVVAGRVDVVLVHSLTRIGREWGMTQSYICRILRSYKDTPHVFCCRKRCRYVSLHPTHNRSPAPVQVQLGEDNLRLEFASTCPDSPHRCIIE